MSENLLSDREIRRYTRQIILPEIGIAGQHKLKNARVLVVGAGGLGCPVLQYLSAAGIGKVTIAESDIIDETNLQRQVLYGSDDIGKLKSIIARAKLKQLNPFVVTEIFNIRLGSSNAIRIIKDHDIIVDATDNYPSRYLINDACVILNKPMVHGAVFKFEGQVSVFNYDGGPTYRCYNPSAPHVSDKNPSPSDTGLFGVLPGITGTIMANEVIKIITGTGNILSGKILIFSILDYSFNIIKINNVIKNHCITELLKDY